jgi:hypothetical protein
LALLPEARGGCALIPQVRLCGGVMGNHDSYSDHVIRFDIRAMPEVKLIHPDGIFKLSAISDSYNHWKDIIQAKEHIFLSNERVD